jgi:pimeloyl-ACP methyl ester carboxylesterase
LLGIEPWRAALEFLSHKVSFNDAVGTGDGHPVIIFPGLAADGLSVAPLRDYCSKLGYTATDWGRGRNTGPTGDVSAWMQQLSLHIEDLLLGRDPATLIGWSLGGLYAREVAKLLPDRIRQVISIGTPFNATADHTNVGWLYRLLNGGSTSIHPLLAAKLRQPPPVLLRRSTAARTESWLGRRAATKPARMQWISKSMAAT